MSFQKSFLNICLAFCVYLILILGLAIFGYFKFWIILIVSFFFILSSLLLLIIGLKGRTRRNLNRTKIACFILIFLFSFLIGFFHHDLPTGRDDLSYIYASDRLVQSGSLKWDDYFSRPVHGVRNLGGDTFTSQFLPLYIGYLAVYYLFGGLNLMFWANTLLMLFSLGIIYYLTKSLSSEKASLLTLIFIFSSYVFFWFPKRTNVENIFLFLIWLGLWLLVEAINQKKPIYLLGGLVPFSLLILTRPEGLIFFAFYLIVAIILIIKNLRQTINPVRSSHGVLNPAFAPLRDKSLTGFAIHYKHSSPQLSRGYSASNGIKEKIYLSFLPLSAVLVNFLLLYFYLRFYQAGYIVNQLVDVLEEFEFIYQNNLLVIFLVLFIILIILGIIFYRKKINWQRLLFWLIFLLIIAFELVIIFFAENNKLEWNLYRSQYVLENFAFYFNFIFILIILFGLRKKIFTKNEFWLTLVLLPAFLFILEPNIALDHPWFMRRFYPTLIPLFLVLASIALTRLKITKKPLTYFVALVILVGIITTWPIYSFVEHKGIRSQIESFNAKFPESALIVMNPGWAWQKIAVLQHYFYGLNALPNLDLFRYEEAKKELPQVLKQYPLWEEKNEDLVGIMNWFNDQSENYFMELLKNYPEVYVVSDQEDSQFFSGFKDANLQKIDSFTFNFQELKTGSNITAYIRKYDFIELKAIQKLRGFIPPTTFSQEAIKLQIFKVKNPQEYLSFEYVLDVSQMSDKEKVYRLLQEVDLKNFRKDFKNILRGVSEDLNLEEETI